MARLLAIGFGLLIAIAIGEIGVRVLDIPPRPLAPIPINQFQLSTNPVLQYEQRPDLPPDVTTDPAWLAGFTTNSQGFRDRERSPRKPGGTRRVLVIGDSITAGNLVRDTGVLFPQRLERMLDATSADTTWEVFNMGVGGYHTLQEIETLRVKGLRYDPDVVLVAFCVNDFGCHADGGTYRRLKRRNPEFAGGPDSRSLLGRVVENSRLAFLVHYHLRARFATPVEEDPCKQDLRRGRTPVDAGFELLAELQAREGFEVLIFIVPGFDKPLGAYRHHEIHAKVFEIASRYPTFRVVDLTDSFAAVNPDLRTFAIDGIHLTEAGHQVLAEILRDLMADTWPELGTGASRR